MSHQTGSLGPKKYSDFGTMSLAPSVKYGLGPIPQNDLLRHPKIDEGSNSRSIGGNRL